MEPKINLHFGLIKLNLKYNLYLVSLIFIPTVKIAKSDLATSWKLVMQCDGAECLGSVQLCVLIFVNDYDWMDVDFAKLEYEPSEFTYNSRDILITWLA